MHAKQKWIFGVLIIVAMSGSAIAQDRTLKVLNFNVLHGFDNDSAKTATFIRWVKERNPDVIAFQELNGFDHAKLKALAATYGHPYAVINTGVTHPIGLTSRYPISNVDRDTVNLWHSYLYGKVKDVHFFVTHLSPFEVKIRRHDISLILEKAGNMPAGEKVVIAGDFNALAAADSLQYDSLLLKAMLRSEGRREPKSGLPIVKGKTIYRNNLDNGRIDYTVTNKMLEAGFQDAFYLVNKRFKHSVPTKGHASKKSKLRRIDYIWVNQQLAGQVVATDIIQDPHTDHLSDHYPVWMELRYSPEK